MNPNVQTILELIQTKTQFGDQDRNAICTAAQELEKALSLAEFKVSRFNKEQRTVSVLLEETIDELKMKSAVLEEANQSLTQTLNHLRATQSQLIMSEKMASLGELTAGISHEIQNPLNFINNFSEVSIELCAELTDVLGRELPAPVRKEIDELMNDLTQNLAKINEHGNRASSIIQGMLQHSRTSTGQKEPTNLNALADKYLRLAYHGLRAKDKSFVTYLITDLDPEIGEVAVVPQDIGRVLLNLYSNAFYATQQRGKQEDISYKPQVRVQTRKVNDQVEIRVWDNGIGIPESVKNKIFQPFFTTKPTGQGTGLGLSLSYDIVTKGHGGVLHVESEVGHHTEFILQLPTRYELAEHL